jgi:saccharopepsin
MVAGVKGLWAAAATVSGFVLELPATVCNSYSSVTGKLGIGSPPQPHQLMFDTGSWTVWISDTDCTETSCPNYSSPYCTRQEYNASASSLADASASRASIPFLGGNVTGRLYQDAFSTDGATMHGIKLSSPPTRAAGASLQPTAFLASASTPKSA